MTGTALTEEEEFQSIYALDIVEIPTNKPVIRIDRNGRCIQESRQARTAPSSSRSSACYAKGQPVLVGTISIEKSEYISSLLRKQGVPHSVLNAKHHEKEAEIVAQAGKLGAVTIATNMAGRGTDIMLGGNPEYLAKSDLRRAGYDEDTISEATGYAETEDEDDPRSARSLPRKDGRAQGRDGRGGRKGARRGRTVHPRHRAARVAPYR